MINKNLLINERIPFPKLHLIDQDGKSLGVLDLAQARYLAYQAGLDLAIVNPRSQPPLAKMVDYGKFRYEQQKKESKQKSKAGRIKEIRLSLNIGEHDLLTRVKRAKEFFSQGNKVRAVVIMRGRENIYRQKAIGQIEKFGQLCEAAVEDKIVIMGNRAMGTLIKEQKE